jgi:nicotinate-nucleotide pyrophosphorylase (carboxylating)
MKLPFKKDLEFFLAEDDFFRAPYYFNTLPDTLVECLLHIKSPMVLAGLPYFLGVFESLAERPLESEIMSWEGQRFDPSTAPLKFTLPFNIALTGERLALNLLSHASAVATYTRQFVDLAQVKNIAILDTRKTTPGLRSLEKYAVLAGGGENNRFGQSDIWMIKDNHKMFFGGIKNAVEFFNAQRGFYKSLVLEVHDLRELQEAIDLKLRHVMLDNFCPEDLKKALSLKPDFMTFEVSGGISLENIDDYLMEGVNAISIGGLTQSPPRVDLSLKMRKMNEF